MTSEVPRHSKSDPLVSENIRGAVYMLVPRVDPWSVINAWQRAGFGTPVGLSGITSRNAYKHDSESIFTVYAHQVDWTGVDQSSRALKALSTITRKAHDNVDDSFDSFWADYRELEIACTDDGFNLSDNGTITQAGGIRLDDLDLSQLSSTEGVLREVKRLNRAMSTDRDMSDVVGHAKNLMEAVAASLLKDFGMDDAAIRKLQVQNRAAKVHELLEINKSTGVGKTTDGLESIRKGLNKLIDGVKDLRTQESVAGHGLHVVPDIPRADAQLAIDASLAWCRYVIETFNRKQGEAESPF